MKQIVLVVCFGLLVGCNAQTPETMTLLDAPVSEVELSESLGLDGMNEEILMSLKDEQSIKVFEKAIITAVKQPSKTEKSEPDYDVMVNYKEDANGEGYPIHGLHLWLGNEDEKSSFMYIGDDVVYLTSKKATNELRSLILEK